MTCRPGTRSKEGTRVAGSGQLSDLSSDWLEKPKLAVFYAATQMTTKGTAGTPRPFRMILYGSP